jgi:hypothetical protein
MALGEMALGETASGEMALDEMAIHYILASFSTRSIYNTCNLSSVRGSYNIHVIDRGDLSMTLT